MICLGFLWRKRSESNYGINSMEIAWRSYGESEESDTFDGDFMIQLIWRLSQNSIESDTFYGDFIMKSVWRLSGNLIQNVFSTKTANKLHNLYI